MTGSDSLSCILLASLIERSSLRGVLARRVARRYREKYGAGILDSIAVEAAALR